MRIQELEQAQAAAEATRRALESEISQQQDEIGARDRALVQARADFSGELEKLRASADLAQDRLQAVEKRALLEIEHERVASARSQKELEAAARRAEQGETRHRKEVQALQGQLGDARHRAGIIEGNLEALRSSNATYVRELDALRLKLAAVVANQSETLKRLRSSVETRKPRHAAPKVAARKRSAT
ncbi:MAG TPA: hypothetical protein VEI25_13765 [Paraburkholderia sp.]|nr:hypothetical protein [Paraburkholderia sp.]